MWCGLSGAVAQMPATTFVRQVEDTRRLSDAEALDKLEALLTPDLAEAQRQQCYQEIAARLGKFDPPVPNAAEKKMLEQARAGSDYTDEVLLGRYAIVLAGREYADEARRCGFMTQLDMSYIVLRDTFSLDPVGKRGHRYVIWFPRNKPRGFTTNGGSLHVWVGQAEAERPDGLLRYVHEFGHSFVWDFMGNPIFAGGFTEGWCDFCKLIAAERLAVLGEPFAEAGPKLRASFRRAGREEYLRTRLPIEEIIDYAPSMSLLVELLETTRSGNGTLDWSPFNRMLADLAADSIKRPPHCMWPAWHAALYLQYFDRDDVLPILREYRYPPEALAPLTPDAATALADGGEVVREWRVLGPIPDPAEGRLRDDPLDVANFEVRDAYEIDGHTYRWRTVTANKQGVVELGKLEGARESCRFCLVADLPVERPTPAAFYIGSDDDAAVWLDGTLLYTFSGNRGTKPRDPDRACGLMRAGKIVALVANRGGATGFHLRVDTDSPYTRIYPGLLHDGDQACRLGLVEYLASRIFDGDCATALLLEALGDADPRVRARAAWGLGGRRNDAEVVKGLLSAWSTENDADVAEAMGDALSELLFQPLRSASAARRWWNSNEKDWVPAFHVECERAVPLGDRIGGFYGNQDGAYGGQTIDRGWGSGREDELRVRLYAPADGRRRLVIRYRANKDCHLRVRVQRGPETVFDRAKVELSATSKDDWSRAYIELTQLKAGWYTVILSDPSGQPLLDVIGWAAR
jgi:hypothetical protein